MADYTKTPRIVPSKQKSICAETSKEIAKGQRCWFDPATKAVYHLSSQKAKVFQKQLSLFQ